MKILSMYKYCALLQTILILLLPFYNKIFITAASAAVQMNRLTEQSSTPVDGKTSTINEDDAASMTAVLMECAKDTKQPSRKSQGQKSCYKIAVKIKMKNDQELASKSKYLIIDEVYDSKEKSVVKLLEPYLIEIKQNDPVLVYPLKPIEKVNSEKCKMLKNIKTKHSAEKSSKTQGLSNFFDEYNLDNELTNQGFNYFDQTEGNYGTDYLNYEFDTENNVDVTKRQRDPIRACHCNARCQECNSLIEEENKCACCNMCQKLTSEYTNGNDNHWNNQDINNFPANSNEDMSRKKIDNSQKFQYPNTIARYTSRNMKMEANNDVAYQQPTIQKHKIEYSADKKDNEMFDQRSNFTLNSQNGHVNPLGSWSQVNRLPTSDNNGKKQGNDMNVGVYHAFNNRHLNNEVNSEVNNIYNKNVYRKSEKYQEQDPDTKNRYRNPEYLETDQILYYYDNDKNEMESPFESNVQSLWSDSANLNILPTYPNILSSDRLPNNNDDEIFHAKQNRDKDINPVAFRQYDSLMMDHNLTTDDKMQFLATTVDATSKQGKMMIKELNDPTKSNRIIKRSYYDEMTYFDDAIIDHSKYNGDWYTNFMKNINSQSPLSSVLDENFAALNYKNMPKGQEQKIERKQRNSFEELWTVYKINAALSYVQLNIRIFKKCNNALMLLHPQINISNYYRTHYVEDKILITSLFHSHSATRNGSNNNQKTSSRENNYLNNDNNKPYQHNLFNSPSHYLLLLKNIPSLKLSNEGAVLLDLEKISFNITANHYSKVILHEICSALFKGTGITKATTRTPIKSEETATLIRLHAQGKNHHHDRNIVEKDDNNNEIENGKKKIEHKKYIKRDAFNLNNGESTTSRTIFKLNQFSDFPVISQQVINDCPTPMTKYQYCLYVSPTNKESIFDNFEMKIELLNIDINNLLSKNQMHDQRHLLSRNSHYKRDVVQINNIIVDATTHGLLRIQISLTNFGIHESNDTVKIDGCNTFTQLKGEKQIVLRPNKGNIVEFKLQHPVILTMERQQCKVKVFHNDDNSRFTYREFLIEPKSRCFCIWICACICMDAYFDSKEKTILKCQTIKPDLEVKAGFMDSIPPENSLTDVYEEEKLVFDPTSLLFLPLLVLLLLLFLGLLKALLGLCIRPIGKWGYDYIQPLDKYERSSVARRFCINSIFFFITPCLWCCSKCCEWNDNLSDKNKKGHHLNRQLIIKQEQYHIEQNGLSSDESDVPSEADKLLYPFYNVAKGSRDEDTVNGGHMPSEIVQNRLRASGGNPVVNVINEEEDEEDTSFVLSALTESRDSLKCLDGHHSSDEEECPAVVAYVKQLEAAKIVYRTFEKPLANIILPEKHTKFSIRGFFLPTKGKTYQFFTNLPLRQHWQIDVDGKNILPIFPPFVLLSRDFMKTYKDKKEVFECNDLSVRPHISAPCLNMATYDKALYEFTSETAT